MIYWCNQDELELTVQYLMSAVEQSADLVRQKRPTPTFQGERA